MTPAAARRAVAAMGLRVDEHTGNAKPPHWLAFDTPEWHGTVYLGDADRRVTEVLLQGTALGDEAAARRAFDAASASLGAPLSSRRVVGTDGTFVEETRIWNTGGFTLKVELHESIHGADHRWVVFKGWSVP